MLGLWVCLVVGGGVGIGVVLGLFGLLLFIAGEEWLEAHDFDTFLLLLIIMDCGFLLECLKAPSDFIIWHRKYSNLDNLDNLYDLDLLNDFEG